MQLGMERTKVYFRYMYCAIQIQFLICMLSNFYSFPVILLCLSLCTKHKMLQ